MDALLTLGSALGTLERLNLPLLGGVFPFLVALNNAYFLRLALRFRVHWLRLFLTLLLLTTGGGSLVALLMGRAVPWATPGGGGTVPAVSWAFLLFFALRGSGSSRRDWVFRAYRTRALRDGWQLIASTQVALGCSAAAEAARGAGLPLVTQALLGVLGGCGGSLLAEVWDVLLQGHARYTQPIHGPGPGVVLCVWGTALYVLVFRGGVWGGSALPVLAARGALFLVVAAANYFIPGRALSHGSSAALQALSPGFSGIWEPLRPEDAAVDEAAETGVSPWPVVAGLFGYEVASLRELALFARGGSTAALAVDIATQGAAKAVTRERGDGNGDGDGSAEAGSSARRRRRQSIGRRQ